MSCSRGKANPNEHTQRKLWASSGGYCQNPSCNTSLFIEIGKRNIHIAEFAHIISTEQKGPRYKKELTDEETGSFNNLIILCPTCHTKIDKAEEEFPESLIKKWKINHEEKIKAVIGICIYKNKKQLHLGIAKYLKENKMIFDKYGPETEERFNPESELPILWKKKIFSKIIPNNRKILAILDNNIKHLTIEEQEILELFRQHVDDFENRHLWASTVSGMLFPTKLYDIFGV